MLVLSRLRGEEILIGDDVTIKVAYIKGDRVGIAVDAPRDVRVDRKEVREAIEREMSGAD